MSSPSSKRRQTSSRATSSSTPDVSPSLSKRAPAVVEQVETVINDVLHPTMQIEPVMMVQHSAIDTDNKTVSHSTQQTNTSIHFNDNNASNSTHTPSNNNVTSDNAVNHSSSSISTPSSRASSTSSTSSHKPLREVRLSKEQLRNAVDVLGGHEFVEKNVFLIILFLFFFDKYQLYFIFIFLKKKTE